MSELEKKKKCHKGRRVGQRKVCKHSPKKEKGDGAEELLLTESAQLDGQTIGMNEDVCPLHNNTYSKMKTLTFFFLSQWLYFSHLKVQMSTSL